jgi:hypothetical protein
VKEGRMDKTSMASIIEQIGERQIQREINRYQDEIESYRWWGSEEAKCRIVANIRSLNRLGATKIDLMACYLERARLENTNLDGSDFYKTNLRGANLNKASLREACIMRSNLQGASLVEADLRGADLTKVNLRKAHVTDVNFNGAELYEVDLREAKWLTIKQLSETKTLYLTKLDPDLMSEIEANYPDLLVNPDFKKE